MKIVEETADRLIVENNPVWAAVLLNLFFGLFLAIGLFTLPTEPLLGGLFTAGHSASAPSSTSSSSGAAS